MSVATAAQDKGTFAQWLKSEEGANQLISALSAYDAKSPWTSESEKLLRKRSGNP